MSVSETHFQCITKFTYHSHIIFRSERLNHRCSGTAIIIRQDFSYSKPLLPLEMYGSGTYPTQCH
jgi:hypothetical protein